MRAPRTLPPPFPAERRDIYRGVKILDDGKGAEYVFEQISVEREIDDPDAPDGSGKRMVAERLYADFDEFVAALWEKGLRFGIDALVLLLRTKHTPARWDFGLRYLDDLPQDVAVQVDALLPTSRDRLATLTTECLAWQRRLLAELAG